MLRPAAIQILKNNESYYSLVVGVAKRAREITANSYEEKTVLNERPVKKAVDEFAAGDYKLVEDPSLRN